MRAAEISAQVCGRFGEWLKLLQMLRRKLGAIFPQW
jgi:hypothetical protein